MAAVKCVDVAAAGAGRTGADDVDVRGVGLSCVVLLYMLAEQKTLPVKLLSNAVQVVCMLKIQVMVYGMLAVQAMAS